jgi:hypothetical protein
MNKLKKKIFNYLKKDPYDDWIEHILMKFIMPPLLGICVVMIFYCILGMALGWTPPNTEYVPPAIIVVP